MRAVAVADERELPARRRARAGARAAAMEGQALVADVSTPEPYVFSDTGRPHVAVVDYGTKRSILRRLAQAGAAVTVLPALRRARRARGVRRRRALERAGRPGAARGRGRGRARPARTHADPRNLPRPPAPRPRDRPQDVQAPVRPPRREPPGARPTVRARARHEPEPRLRGRALGGDRGDARLALRRDGRGLRLPGAARALGPVPPRGRPGPARRVADPRVLGARRLRG